MCSGPVGRWGQLRSVGVVAGWGEMVGGGKWMWRAADECNKLEEYVGRSRKKICLL